MNDALDMEAARVLAGARRALSPTSEDANRVLLATRSALLTAAAGPGSLPAFKVSGGVATAKLIVAAVCIAGVSGAFGYMLGYRAAIKSQPAVALVAPKPLLPAASAGLPVDTAKRPSEQTEPLPATQAEIPPVAQQPTAPVMETRAQTRAKPFAAPHPGGAAPVVSETAPGSSLEAEVSALRRVELALREDRPRQALSILDELERDVPNGKLAEERLAAFLVARCAIGLGSRAALVREFIGNHPDSVYRARVEQACRAKAGLP